MSWSLSRPFGSCSTAPGYSVFNCPHTCNMCDLLDPEKRCLPLYNNDTAFPAHAINATFESLLTRFQHRYNITIHSRNPYILSIENLVASKDADELISLLQHKFTISSSIGPADEIGRVEQRIDYTRTSQTAWCQSGCDDHHLIQKYTSLIEEMTQVSKLHYEHYQFLRYSQGEYYQQHHDVYSSSYPLDAAGPRALTILLYLSDVAEGGETFFPALKPNSLQIKPKKGSALIWSNLLSASPAIKDPRVVHEAKPVLSNDVKYAANLWVHSHNYRRPNNWGCTG
jgi:prolyl 4-hydroxylase